jgi:hypothetical protein
MGAFDGWQQIGGSNTNYAAVGVGDFYGIGTDDILRHPVQEQFNG